MFTHFTSDLHLGHANVIKYSNRPFASVEEMNSELIRRYNAVVDRNANAFVLFVGDVALCGFEVAYQLLQRMHGRKALVLGNHDRSPAQMARLGFEFVATSLTLPFGGDRIIRVSHKPYEGMDTREITRSGGDTERKNKLPVWARAGRQEALLHGHTHSKQRRNGLAVHVGVDAWDYAPATSLQVAELLDDAFKS